MTYSIRKRFKPTEYKTTHSKYDNAPKLPEEMVTVAQSNSGKPVLISDLILDVYKDCLNSFFILPPSLMVDDNFIPVRKY